MLKTLFWIGLCMLFLGILGNIFGLLMALAWSLVLLGTVLIILIVNL